MNTEKYSKVFDAFDINTSNTELIYKYAPVFKCKYKKQTVVLKRTKSEEDKALKLFEWSKYLCNNNVEVVTPIDKNGFNPIKVDDKLWVMYPFIEGRKYNGTLQDIKKAGDFLGRLHLAGENRKTLINGFNWSAYNDEFMDEVKEDIENITQKYKNIVEGRYLNKLKLTIDNMFNKKLSLFKKVELPMVDGCWDYKANNLVYTNGDVPVLIDPDNCGYIPRIFDLALALILFHTEMDTAPGRIFTQVEWEAFKSAYVKHIKITDIEKEIWVDYLNFVFIDEALWAIVNIEDDEPKRQKDFMKSLLMFEPEKYVL